MVMVMGRHDIARNVSAGERGRDGVGLTAAVGILDLGMGPAQSALAGQGER